MEPFLVIIIGFVLIAFLQMLFLMSRYIKCPPDKILVIYGRISEDPKEKYKILTSGTAFVWPVIQEYTFIDITVKEVEIRCKSQLKDHRPILLKINLMYKVSATEKKAMKAVGLFYLKNEEEITDVVQHRLKASIEKEMYENSEIKIDLSPTALKIKLENSISNSLEELGMDLIAIKEIDF